MSQQSDDKDVIGPIILWADYGYEGWKPYSYNSIDEALKASKYCDWIITKKVEWKVMGE